MRRFLILLIPAILFSCKNPVNTIQNGISNLVIGQKEMQESIKAIQNDIKKLASNDSIMNQQLRFYPAAVPTTGNISSFYQIRKDPINGIATFHTGVDIRSPKGTPVLAAGDGKVKKTIVDNGNLGQTIVIDHLNGYESLYGHLSAIEVQPNQVVHRGQEIGRVGSTGRSTGNHLHYEILYKEKKINPGVFRIPFRISS